MRDFDALTSSGRLRRLRRVAVQALRHYRCPDYRLTLVADSFNTLFRVACRDGTYVLRVGPGQRIHAIGAARAEHDWTARLASAGMRVPRIVLSEDGAPSVSSSDAGVPGERECTLLTWTPGRPLTRPVGSADVRDLALLSARLHELSPPGSRRVPGALDGRHALHFELGDLLDELPAPDRPIFRAALVRAQASNDRLWSDAVSRPRLIHSDLTPGNVLRNRTAVTAIDFQDLTWGHVEQDLANTLYGLTRGDRPAEVINLFRSAYEQVRAWPALDEALLADLIAARRLEMVNLAVAMKRPVPTDYIRRHSDALTDYLR